MSEESISLFQLLDLAIGTPQRGAVNFSALHALLHAVLRQLDIREIKTPFRVTPPGDIHPVALVGVTTPQLDHDTEEEQHQVHRDISTVEQEVQPGTDLKERAASSSSPTPSSGPAATDQWTLQSRIQTCEDGVAKAMKPIQDVQSQNLKNLKKETKKKMKEERKEEKEETEDEMKKETEDETEEEMTEEMKKETKELRQQQKMVGAPSGTASDVEKCCRRVDALEKTVRSLRNTLQKYPDPKELSQCVTWDDMQKELVNSGVVDPATYKPFNSNFTAVRTSSPHPVKDTGRPAAPSSPSISGQISTDTRTATEPPSVPSGPPQPLAREASSSETAEALKNIGKLKEGFGELEARVAALEEDKVDQSQLMHLKKLIANHDLDSKDALNNLMDQLNQQQALIDSLIRDREKDVELVNDVQKAILHLQAECQKLHETTRCLHEDNRQKQSHIEELYKTTEELGEKKADKEMVESEIKADKFALESKVSRLQFDSATEQLNAMFHELLNKVTGHEQDWHKVIDKLSTEMECKLNRMELDSVKKQLENRWKNIHEKLQAQGAPEHEDAAGIRKQLVDRFHCLSCDRPVVMHTPGQHLAKQPSTPGFPSHKSIRPFTVYALEQFRQHYRSLKPGSNRYNFVVAGRRREQLQNSHAVMCRQIESMQRKHCDSTASYGTAGDSLIQNQPGDLHERISEMTDYSHLAASRSCGGSHTVTMAGQRRPVLQYMKHNPQTEVDAVIPSEEVDIIGLDGHIYKGRLNASTIRNTETKLPTISTKDGMCKTKDKAKCSPSHKPASSPELGHGPPVYPPHSAKSTQCSRSTSSSSGRDWPVSALGCTSQLGSVSPASAAAESLNTEPAAEQLLNL
ncbi:glutamine-rich protein 2 isoform X3 [Sander lucioperca]|uniref:glutamine-rich protein 2 isoform X3 n=1 Tax=Sander lucioperca TaxID=283035 RepID=UPI0016535399|nr:glutamine-rich protein 2 isoform X3 [Sander lucioperca]